MLSLFSRLNFASRFAERLHGENQREGLNVAAAYRTATTTDLKSICRRELANLRRRVLNSSKERRSDTVTSLQNISDVVNMCSMSR